MSYARSSGALLGTNESTGVTISNNATSSSSAIDLLGDETSVGECTFYLVFTGSGTSGSIQLRFNSQRDASGTAQTGYAKTNYELSIPPINGTQKIPLGRRSVTRFLSVDVLNNGTGGSLTNVSVLYELEKYS